MQQLLKSNRLLPGLLRLATAIACSLLILALLLEFVSGTHDAAQRPRLINLLSATALSGFIAYLPLHFCGIVVRAYRYQLLLRAAGEPSVPSLPHMTLVTGFRNMVVDMLPSRIGELGYVALLNRAYGITAGNCFSSLAVSTVFDFFALAAIILIAIAFSIPGGGVDPWLFSALAMAILVSVLGVLTLTRLVPRAAQVLQTMGGDHGIRRLVSKLADLAVALDQGLVETRGAGILGRLFGLSLVIRCLKYLSIYLLFMAVARPSLPALAEAANTQVLAAIVGAEIGASLPIPTFMSFGSYEAGGTFVFHLLDIDRQAGLIALLATHIWSQVVDYSIGALCLGLVIWFARGTRPGKDRPQKATNRPRGLRLAIAGAGTLLMASLLAVAWQYRGIQKMGTFTAPPRGESLREHHPDHRDALQTRLAELDLEGFMVWSSNRSGNHDILRMNLANGEISPLTRHPHTETWPRISGDGQQLLFARSRQPWVSQRNAVAWDVVLLDLGSNRERVLAEYASWPFWIDNQTVGYLKNGNTVIQQSLNDGDTGALLDPEQNSPVAPTTGLTSPDYNADTDRLTFTARQSAIGMQTGFWGTATWQPDTADSLRGVLDGCQLTWSANNQFLYQVGHGGRQKTQIYRIDPQTLEARPILDLDGEFSHEYWPRDDHSGRFMVLGASRSEEEHEHDTEDYEIFLWPTGSPAESAIRMTYHTGNDNWPDIYTTTSP